MEDTIVSQATPSGFSAISIVRLSGKRALSYSKRLTKKKQFKHNQPTLSSIYIKNSLIDKGMVTAFHSPNSYTGEDIVEIACHGNPNITTIIIEELVSFGSRIAEPGEYTKRAYLNGKLNLLQAEAVGLLIESKTLEAIERQTNNLSGGITEKIREIKNDLLVCVSILEFEFDVSEEEYLTKDVKLKIINYLKTCRRKTKALNESFKAGHAYTNGLKISFMGKPNVGKSTLVNKIINIDRSITSSIPGTTRDMVLTETTIGGFPTTLIDTAGIHETKNEIERKGIEKSTEEIMSSDLVVSVFTKNKQPIDIKELKNKILVYNKIDVAPYKGNKTNVVSVSAKEGTGVDLLKEKILEKINITKTDSSEPLITTIRQKEAIRTLDHHIRLAIESFINVSPELEITAIEIRSAISQIDLFTGKTTTNDILEKVFSGFCVGK